MNLLPVKNVRNCWQNQLIGQEIFRFQLSKKVGYLPKNTIEEKTSELLAFFSISNFNAWEDYYFKQQLKVAFRISLAHTNEPYAISAWLRKGNCKQPNYLPNPMRKKILKRHCLRLKASWQSTLIISSSNCNRSVWMQV